MEHDEIQLHCLVSTTILVHQLDTGFDVTTSRVECALSYLISFTLANIN